MRSASPGDGSDAKDAEPSRLGAGVELEGDRFRYRVIRCLGRGAFGAVYLAACLDAEGPGAPPAEVAIKVLGSRSQSARDLARRELSALLALRTDRIPPVFDWCLEREPAFVAMAHCARGSLRERLREGVPATEEEVWRLLSDLLCALEAAHRVSLLHLDIKPANVLLDDEGGFLLTDFGVSQSARLGWGVLPVSIGSQGYRAPEQELSELERYDLRTDLYSVGVTAWAFALGRDLVTEPVEADRELADLRSLRPEISPALDQLLAGLVRREPGERPGSASEVLHEVRARTAGVARTQQTRGTPVAPEAGARREVIDGLVDPLLRALCERGALAPRFVRFEDGERLCAEGEESFSTFLLLSGTVRVSQDGVEIARVRREGSFLGEVATLTGLARTATLDAEGTVWVAVLSAAELERFVVDHPAMGLRMIRSMATRLSRVPGAKSELDPEQAGSLR